MISTHIRTEGLYVKTTIFYQLKRLCVPDCAYTENMFINSIHISLYDISLTQNILYQIKRDEAVWKRLGCPQRNQRTWWQIVVTPYTGLAWLVQLNGLASDGLHKASPATPEWFNGGWALQTAGLKGYAYVSDIYFRLCLWYISGCRCQLSMPTVIWYCW